MDENILRPGKAPSSEAEATYIGLYTFLISVISLSGGSIGESKLERYLKRTNADQYTPIDKTEKVLQRMCKEGYLVKLKDSTGGEEIVEYMVGPRGKVEVGVDAVIGVARTVYGDEDVDDLDARVQRSMGIDEGQRKKTKKKEKSSTATANGQAQTNGTTPGRRTTRGSAAAEAVEQGEEEEDDEESGEEDDEDDDDDEESEDD